MKRQCAILMPVSSLPSRFGIGCFDREAYAFIDFLADAGQSMWQVLPFCQTGFGDSPYQSVSSFAGNPYFIDLEQLIGDGLLSWQECESARFGSDPERVDYGALYENRYAEAVSRVQSERGQRVCSTGPYGFVRHPMYSAILMWCVAIVGVFPTWQVTLVSIAVAVLIVVRTLLEDAMLAEGLPGYAEYRSKVRWRLIPFVL